MPGVLTWPINRRLAGALTVSDAEVAEAVRFAFRHLKLVVEPGGAVSLAALQHLHTTSELVEGLTRQPLATGDLALPSAPVAGITPLPGGVVVRWQGHLLAGLGVSGARQGLVDEACALEAEAALQRQLEQPPPT